MSPRAALGLAAIGLLYLVRYHWVFEIAWFKDDFLFLDLARRLRFPEIWGFRDAIGNAWRPLSRNVYFWLGDHVFGRDPAGYHAVNLAVALAGLLLLFLVARRLLAPRGPAAAAEGPALLATLLFALHPAAGTPSTWVCGIQDLLVVTLALAAVLAHLGGRRVLYVVLFVAAVLAKEVAVALPAVLVLHDRLLRGDPLRRALARQLPALAFVGLWLAFNRWLPWNDLGATVHTGEPGKVSPLGHADLGTAWLALRCLFLVEPIEAFAWPYGAPATAGMAALALVAIGLCERLPWPRRAPAGLLAVAGLWSASGLAPLIAVNSHFVYYAYYPSVGLALAVVALLAGLARPRWTRLQAVRAGAAVLLAAVLAAGAGAKHDGAQHDTHSIRRANRYLAGFKRDLLRQHPAFPEGARCFFWNVPYFIGFQLADGPALRVWYDDLTLEGRFIREYTPDRTRPTFFFVHDHAGHLVEVTPGYPDPDLAHPPAEYADAHAHLAYWLSRVGEMDRAILECRKALEVEPDHRAATANLGIFLVETGAPDEGAPALERAILLDPGMAELRFYLGAAYARLARLGEAERELTAFVRMAPASPNRPIAVTFLEQIRRDLGQPGRER